MCIFNDVTNAYGFLPVFDGADPHDKMVALLVDVHIPEVLQAVFDRFGFFMAFGIHRLDKESLLTGMGWPCAYKQE
ncbi:MAG: hypothetical protein V1766_13325 [Pseudomonadota bacterium]